MPEKQALHWAFWTRVSHLADYVAAHPPEVKFTVVGLERYGVPPRRGLERECGGAVSAMAGPLGLEAEAPFALPDDQAGRSREGDRWEDEREAEDNAEIFRRRVADRVRQSRLNRREGPETAVRARLDALEFVSLAAYLRDAGEGEVPPNVAAGLRTG